MDKRSLVGLFVLGAALSWGVYVPLVHEAATKLGSNLRAFLFVGIAYFLAGVMFTGFLIFTLKYDPTIKPHANWGLTPATWGILAGTAGAIGALCVIFAVTTAGQGGAIYVAPLVFAGAPIVNTIATITYFHPVKTLPSWQFFAGLIMAAAGAALVMLYKPVDKPAESAKPLATADAPASPPTGTGH